MTLVAAYSFDTGAVVDNSGRGHSGTLFNSPTFPAGHTNLGIEFDSASSEYVEIDDHADFALGTSWTIMAWVKITSIGAANSMVSKPNQWWFSFDAAAWYHGVYKSGGGTASINSLLAPGAGVWTHVAGRYNGTNMQIVLNGTEDNSGGEAGVTMDDTADKVRLGTWDGASEFLDGIIDDVRIYQSEYLNDAAITVLMNTPVTSGAASAADNPPVGILGVGAGW